MKLSHGYMVKLCPFDESVNIFIIKSGFQGLYIIVKEDGSDESSLMAYHNLEYIRNTYGPESAALVEQKLGA